MPHAETSQQDSLQDQDALDDDLIKQALDPQGNLQIDFSRALEPGEKADDAIDYEDISDDDLAEDLDEKLPAASNDQQHSTSSPSFEGLGQDDGLSGLLEENAVESDNLDDLFGDAPSSPTDEHGQRRNDALPMAFDFEGDEGDEIFGDPIGAVQGANLSPVQKRTDRAFDPVTSQDFDFAIQDESISDEQLLQQRLFAQSRKTFEVLDFPPAPPESQEQLLQSLWPKFERNTVPKFMDLLPPKRARYIGKTPSKVPKPVQPTKISLELAPDHEKNFKFSAGASKRAYDSAEQHGLVVIREQESSQNDSDDEMDVDSDYENEPIGGVSWQDFQVVCGDWDIESICNIELDESVVRVEDNPDDLFGDFEESFRETGRPSAKRRKLEQLSTNILETPRFAFPKLHDPEQITAQISKRIILDLNDPHLLIDEGRSTAARNDKKTKDLEQGQSGRTAFSKNLIRRYNISNDEAYEKLKQNHQSKVRSTLGNLTISHSLPALRLQWPYYKTKLAKQEARSFHRPMAHFSRGEPITFQVPKTVKRKHLKGKDTHAIYNQTDDLSMSDNSHVLLLEYSEEYPTMLSNFGMGSRLINYYRKKHQDDTERPKLDIGELAVLLPNDTSPLTQFGEIKAGQTTPTIYNGMYKAPVFKQDPKPTDFLVIRNGTGREGGKWFLRNIEYLRAVGQQFPSVEVPPPGGRKVTTASKNRLKMIAYRLIRRKEPHRIGVGEITKHIADSSDMQNRQKMKDFMVFSKEYKEWEMRPGEQIPDEEVIRSMVSPEDVCLLESMQVGQQHLEDSGFGDEFNDTMNEDVDEAKENQSIEQQLAPWQTSKNFLNAAANKAMLQLHGEGDPSGRGEAFSFLKTSMKGGFKAIGESVEDKLDAKKLKELGGHSYNVQKQAESYRESIRRIWDAQNQSLSSTIEHSDDEVDLDEMDEISASVAPGMTPRSEAQTPSFLRRRDDETGSQFSRFSTDSQSGRVLKIHRKVQDSFGNIVDEVSQVDDPRVIKQYLAKRRKKEADAINISDIRPDDDREIAKKKLTMELLRLERNRDRRFAREKQKAGVVGGAGPPRSPSSPVTNVGGGGGRGGPGTQRKCANCGQVGHIKTNKKCKCPLSFSDAVLQFFERVSFAILRHIRKYLANGPYPTFRLCPLLNGTMKQEEGGFGDSAFSTATQ